jgi:ferrous iron transport protein B
MGGVILTASVIIWSLGYFPRNVNYTKDYNKEIAAAKTFIVAPPNNNKAGFDPRLQQQQIISKLEHEKEPERQQNSYIGRVGRFIEPIMRPLGFDWRMSVSLISGIAAKEVIISTMGILYQVETGNDNNQKLVQRLRDNTYQTGPNIGKRVFSPPTAFAFLTFILIYFPCVAVIAAISKESDSWKIAMGTAIYTTVLAWILAFFVYQAGTLIV